MKAYKSLTALLLAAAMVFTLVGCSGGANTPTAPQQGTSADTSRSAEASSAASQSESVSLSLPQTEEESEDGLHASIQRIVASPDWVTRLEAAQDEDTRQIFVVAALGIASTVASVSMHQRDEDGKWMQVLSTPGYVGLNGCCADADHYEGCGQTPMGTYRFNRAFGIAPDPGCKLRYTQVTEDNYWSGDDREGMHYNEMVNIRDFPGLNLSSSEHIMDYEYQYQYCLNISFNEDGTPGRGSAIFLHCLGPTKPYTGGCVAVPENIMKLIMRQVDPECVVVIDTLDNLGAVL